MRFSLGMLLAAMAYVALVICSIVSANSALASIAWTVTAITFCYAAVTLCFARGKRQAIALGFVLLTSAYVAVHCFFVSRTPAAQLLAILGYGVLRDGTLYALKAPPIIEIISLSNVQGDRSLAGGRWVLSAANAAGTMLAGMIGCGIGAMAFRHSHES